VPQAGQPLNAAAYAHAPECPHEAARCVRLFAWTVTTSAEGWFLFHQAPIHNWWVKLACLLVLALINWLIVRKPVEIYRKVEIRPDCLIIEGADIFWLRFMECGWPTFRRHGDGISSNI
jgi:hypothetical protein